MGRRVVIVYSLSRSFFHGGTSRRVSFVAYLISVHGGTCTCGILLYIYIYIFKYRSSIVRHIFEILLRRQRPIIYLYSLNFLPWRTCYFRCIDYCAPICNSLWWGVDSCWTFVAYLIRFRSIPWWDIDRCEILVAYLIRFHDGIGKDFNINPS